MWDRIIQQPRLERTSEDHLGLSSTLFHCILNTSSDGESSHHVPGVVFWDSWMTSQYLMNRQKRKHSRRNAENCLKGEVRVIFPCLFYVLEVPKSTRYELSCYLLSTGRIFINHMLGFTSAVNGVTKAGEIPSDRPTEQESNGCR